MIHVSNHRHIPDVVFFVHDPPQLVRSKLHLQTIRINKNRQRFSNYPKSLSYKSLSSKQREQSGETNLTSPTRQTEKPSTKSKQQRQIPT
jgi:hypothetical protein